MSLLFAFWICSANNENCVFLLFGFRSLITYSPLLIKLTPTTHRELAIQIAEQFGVLGAAMGVRVALVIGGMNMMKQGAELARRPHIVIATPGQTHITLYSIRRRRPFQYDQIS